MTVVRMDFTHLRVFQVRLKLTKARKEKVNGESSSGFRKVTGFHLADAWIVAEPLGYLQIIRAVSLTGIVQHDSGQNGH